MSLCNWRIAEYLLVDRNSCSGINSYFWRFVLMFLTRAFQEFSRIFDMIGRGQMGWSDDALFGGFFGLNVIITSSIFQILEGCFRFSDFLVFFSNVFGVKYCYLVWFSFPWGNVKIGFYLVATFYLDGWRRLHLFIDHCLLSIYPLLL